MSDPNKPKTPPVETPTKAFVLKMDGWFTDLMKNDLEADLNAPAEEPAEPAAPEAKPEGNGTERGG